MIGVAEILVIDLDTVTDGLELFPYCEKYSCVMLGQIVSLLLKHKLVRGICVNVCNQRGGFWWAFIVLFWLPKFCNPSKA